MPFDRHAKLAFVIACITLLATSIGFQASLKHLKFYLKKEPVELRHTFANIARTLPRWKAVGEDEQLDVAVLEELGTRQYLDRHYMLDENGSKVILSMQVTYYTGMIDTVPHVPDRCMVAGGYEFKTMPTNYSLPVDMSKWREDRDRVNQATGKPYPVAEHVDRITNQLERIRMPIGEFQLRTTEFQWPRRPELRVYGGYLFIANGRTTPTPDSIRTLAFDRTNKYAYYCKVQFNMLGRNNTEPEEFVRLSADLMGELLPELMRCLPDWSEVEARERAESEAQTASRTPERE